MICVLESCKDFGGRPRELFCSPESRAELTIAPLVAAGIGAGAAALTGGLKYGLAGLSKAGRAQKREEKAAAKRLRTPGAYGLTEAQKRSMIGDTVRAMIQQSREKSGDIMRAGRARGPLSGGQTLQALGQVERGIASGAAQTGGKVAQLSTQVAQQQKAGDIAAVQRAYQRRVGVMKDWLDPTLKAGLSAGAAQSQALAGEALGSQAWKAAGVAAT